jgi:hypothetical protein
MIKGLDKIEIFHPLVVESLPSLEGQHLFVDGRELIGFGEHKASCHVT